MSPGRAPDGHQVLFAAEPVRARREQPAEPDIAARPRLVEQQKRGDPFAAFPARVDPGEHHVQQQIPFPGGVVQRPAR